MAIGRTGKNLTENVRCAILADYLDWVPIAAIAKAYGISRGYPPVIALRAGFPRRRRAKPSKRDWLRVSSFRIPQPPQEQAQ